jgi:hypothetical protein
MVGMADICDEACIAAIGVHDEDVALATAI